MERFVAAVPLPCLMVDASGRVLSLNSSAEDLLQRSQKTLSGRGLEHVLVSTDVLRRLLITAQKQGHAVHGGEIDVDDPHAGQHQLSVHLAPYEAGAWILTLVPATPQALAARASALKDRAGSLSAMAGMLAHEIKNPLAAISGAAQLMADHNPEMAQLIVAETQRITQLLDTMELFSSPQDLEVSPVNVHEVMGEVCQVARLSFGSHVTFIEDYDPSLPPVWANPHVLHRIFLNLVKNACEACGTGDGKVRLRSRFHVSERRRVRGGVPRTDLPIMVSVIDNGTGISPENQDKIFDAFVTTKDQGRGLGLAYVTGAVASMDGTVDLVSRPGVTEFQLRLPQA